MQFVVLGPLEVSDDGHTMSLGGPKQRAVLAMLLLEANRPVPKHRLMDGVWGNRAPSTAEETLDTYIYRLRRLLGPDRLHRHPAGYVLRVGPGELDLSTFEELVAFAQQLRPTDPAAAASSLGEALGLWRGPPLADLRYEPFAPDAIDSLEERRLAALEQRTEAQLAMGLGPGLVPELEKLVRDHPDRERVVAQLVIALYRAGRQSDALAAMQACRRHLALELGLEPGPELRQLEQRILQHDEALAPGPSSAPPRPPSRAVPVSGPRPGRQPWMVAGPAAVITAVALVVTLLSLPGHRAALAVTSDANLLVFIANRSGHPTERAQLPAQPGAMAVAGGDVWVASPSAGAVLEVDQEQGTVVDRIPVEGEPGSLVSGGVPCGCPARSAQR